MSTDTLTNNEITNHQKCCKCGSSDIKTIYKEKGYLYIERVPHSYDESFIDHNRVTKKEFLHKRCSECGYSWVVDTLDYKADNGVQPPNQFRPYPNLHRDPVTILLKGGINAN